MKRMNFVDSAREAATARSKEIQPHTGGMEIFVDEYEVWVAGSHERLHRIGAAIQVVEDSSKPNPPTLQGMLNVIDEELTEAQDMLTKSHSRQISTGGTMQSHFFPMNDRP